MAEVRGHVVMDSTLKPVNSGEARILFKLPGAQRGQEDTQSDDIGDVMRSAEVDGQGHFRFELPVGTMLAQVTVSPAPRIVEPDRAHDDPSTDYVLTKKVLSQPLGAAGVDVTVLVEQAIEFRGLVQDVGTHAPLEGVRIRIDRSGPGPEVLSRADGTFTFRGIQPKLREARFVHADRRDYLASQVPLTPELLLKDAAPLVIGLSRGLSVSGSVFDTQNKPVRGLTLRFRAARRSTVRRRRASMRRFGSCRRRARRSPSRRSRRSRRRRTWTRTSRFTSGSGRRMTGSARVRGLMIMGSRCRRT